MARRTVGQGDAAYRALVAADGALYHWPMDEASGNFAALIGSIALNATSMGYAAKGKLATNAGQFNGVNGTCQTASALALSAYNRIVVEALVVEPPKAIAVRFLWEYSNNYNNNAGAFVATCDGGNSGTVHKWYLGVRGNIAAANYSEFVHPSHQVWHHAAVVYDFGGAAASEFELYVDGVLQAQNGASGETSDNTGNFGDYVLYVGSRNATSFFGPHTMQHLAIYGGAGMTAAKILQHSEASSPVRTAANARTAASARSTASARTAV